MTGWVRIHRGWRDSDVFGSEGPFSEREAWLWLIENVAWKAMTRTNGKGERVRIERGQIHLSLRQLEKVWGWGKNKIARFLQRLENHGMISGTASGQSGHIVTLCNYTKYQDERDSRDGLDGTASGQSRDTQEEGKEGEEQNIPSEAKASSGVDPCPEVVSSWNLMAASCGLSPISKLTAKRRTACQARLRDYGREAILSAIEKVPRSGFLTGTNDRSWRADFDFLLKPDTITRILEGKYDGRTPGTERPMDLKPGGIQQSIDEVRAILGTGGGGHGVAPEGRTSIPRGHSDRIGALPAPDCPGWDDERGSPRMAARGYS